MSGWHSAVVARAYGYPRSSGSATPPPRSPPAAGHSRRHRRHGLHRL